jgi:hypothetical protein
MIIKIIDRMISLVFSLFLLSLKNKSSNVALEVLAFTDFILQEI